LGCVGAFKKAEGGWVWVFDPGQAVAKLELRQGVQFRGLLTIFAMPAIAAVGCACVRSVFAWCASFLNPITIACMLLTISDSAGGVIE